jgi:hypothetical protein
LPLPLPGISLNYWATFLIVDTQKGNCRMLDKLADVLHVASPWTVLAAVMAVVGAILAKALVKATTDIAEIQLEKIVDTFRSRANEARSEAVKAVAEKLPKGASEHEIKAAIETIRAGRDIIVHEVSSEERELVEGLVTNYHQQALSQARAQFWFSIVAASVGFMYILFAAFAADSKYPISFVSIIPGIVVDAVAALFFRQAEQTRQRATELYDRLRQDRQMSRAEAVVETIDDANIKSAVKAQIALHMAGLVPKEIDLKSFLTGIEQARSIKNAERETVR